MIFTVEIKPQEVQKFAEILPEIWKNMPPEIRKEFFDAATRIYLESAPTMMTAFMKNAGLAFPQSGDSGAQPLLTWPMSFFPMFPWLPKPPSPENNG